MQKYKYNSAIHIHKYLKIQNLNFKMIKTRLQNDKTVKKTVEKQ